MKVVIVGDGKVGFALAEQLTMEEHDVSVIDKNQAVLDRLSETLDVLTICGNGASMRVQKEAGVPGSDILIAATSSDELNMLSCFLAKRMGAKHTILHAHMVNGTDSGTHAKLDICTLKSRAGGGSTGDHTMLIA